MSVSCAYENEVLYRDLEAESVDFPEEDVGAQDSKVRTIATFRFFGVLALNTSHSRLAHLHFMRHQVCTITISGCRCQHLFLGPSMSSLSMNPCRRCQHTYRIARSTWQTSSPHIPGTVGIDGRHGSNSSHESDDSRHYGVATVDRRPGKSTIYYVWPCCSAHSMVLLQSRTHHPTFRS